MFALFYVSMSTLIETKMDNSWIDYSRMSLEYEKGVVKFVNFAIENVKIANLIRCSCYKFKNLAFCTPKIVTKHLYWHDLIQSYKTWKWHGEDGHTMPSYNADDPFESIDFNYSNIMDMVNDAYKDCDGHPKAFRKLLEQAEKLVFLRFTKFTKLLW